MSKSYRIHPRWPCAALAALALADGQGARADDSSPIVEKCATEMGTLAVAEPQSYVLFVMTPAAQFSGDTGGIGGVVGGLLSHAGGVLGQLGGLAGGVEFKEAETTLLVADVRSGGTWRLPAGGRGTFNGKRQ